VHSSWYLIGLFAGLGVALGVLLSGALAGMRYGSWLAVALGVAAGVAIGLAIESWPEALAAAGGAAAGVVGCSPLVRGTLRRGGTRGGTAVLLGVGGLVIAGLAFVPALGYVMLVATPLVGLRLRRRGDDRYHGLRILARD
jgi:hypothetical protein